MEESRPARFDLSAPNADLDAHVYAELMKMARAQLGHAGTLSLDAPSLVHEAYLRFHRQGSIAAAERNAFFAYCSRVMRAVIVDYVRERRAQKRGGGAAMLTLTTGIPDADVREDDVERLHESMQSLRRLDARAHQIVELRYFGGLTENEVADVLDVSVPTVKRNWRKARAFLFDAMGSPSP